ncbi:MAG: hypothetical protein AB1730_14955 [Myxococcota bacterium]
MSRFSRFEKLENERKASTESSSGAALDRFGKADPPATETPADVAPFEPRPEKLERFAADGTDAIATDEDELMRLPYLECPSCGAQAGKYERTCHTCSTRLDGHEARAHNLKRLEAYDAERADAAAKERARREAELAEAAALRHEKHAVLVKQLQDIRRRHDEAFGPSFPVPTELLQYLGVWVTIVVAAVLAMELSGAPRFFFGLVAFVLLLSRLPRGAWAILGKRIERR